MDDRMDTLTGGRLPLAPSSQIHPEGRICAHDGCQARLSVYNSGGSCWIHQLQESASFPQPDGLPVLACGRLERGGSKRVAASQPEEGPPASRKGRT